MWRDEIQAWLIARDSADPIEILHHLEYEGHLPLWHFTLFPLTRISRKPYVMQMWHLLLAAAVVYIGARYSPFTRIQKTLFAFGYFAFYEYAVISRCYVLSLLFLLLFCIAYSRRPRRRLLAGVVLTAAAQSSAHALFLVVPCLGLVVHDLISASARPRRGDIFVGLLLPLSGVAAATIQLWPPVDCSIYARWKLWFDPKLLWQTLGTVTRAYLPVPEPSSAFWETNVLDLWPGRAVAIGLLGLGLILYAVWFLRPRLEVAVAFGAATAGLCAFFYAQNLGGLRHNGMLFVTFLVCAWIVVSDLRAKRDNRRVVSTNSHGRHRFEQDKRAEHRRGLWKRRRPGLTLLLTVQAFAGVSAAALDWRHPFSQSEAAAKVIRSKGLDSMPLMGHERPKVSPICGYLGRSMFYPAGNRVASFSKWDKRGDRNVSIDFAMRRARELYHEDVLYISSFPVGEAAMRHYGLRFVDAFEGSTAPGESYWIYVLRAKPTEPDPSSAAQDVRVRAAEEGQRKALLRVSRQSLTAATPAGNVRRDFVTYVNSIGMCLARLPAGRFLMGSRTGDRDEEPVHWVTIRRPFYMGMREVTQRQYELLTGNNPSYLQAPSHPVERISWYEAVEFCRLLTKREGRTYRLPTEAEWEYACRAGTRTRHYWGDFAAPHCSWFAFTSRFQSHPVGRLLPNLFGLFDMNGNVREWCSSAYRPYPFQGDESDSNSEEEASFRVLRGGGWGDLDSRSTSSYRAFFEPSYADIFVGFRVVMSAGSGTEPEAGENGR